MELVTTIAALNALRNSWAPGQTVALVPTMGALHEGHLSLVRQARAAHDRVIVSIFVNPLQFGPSEDFDRYPRTLDTDLALLRPLGVDAVFAPDRAEMYPDPPLTYVDVGALTDRLCGASRPGHFRGVATVVTKLFHLTRPTAAYFGLKDYQQVAVIRRLVADLNFGINIVACETVREPDGLALSSRNRYLSPREREAARCVPAALAAGAAQIAAGVTAASAVEAAMQQVIAAEPLARVDYLAVADPDTLEPLHSITGPALLAAAVYVGSTRLIDNRVVNPAPDASRA